MNVQEKIKSMYKNITKKFAKTKKKSQAQNQSPEYDVSTGPRVSSNGYNVGESVTADSITASLLEDLRNESEIGKQIEIIADRDPDVSMAVWAFQRLAYQGITIEITDLNGNRLTDMESQFELECRNWNAISSDGLDGVIDTLHKTGLLYNIMMIEVVTDQSSDNTFEGIYIIDPRDVEWILEEREGKQKWIPYQDQNGQKVDLTTGNVFWAIANQNMESPIGPYLLQPAVSAVDYKLQTMSDSSAVLRHNGYPCNVWSINKERLVKTLPPADQNRPDKVKKAISEAMDVAKGAAYSRQPTQDIIVTDDIEVSKNSNTTAGSSIDVRAWMETVDVQIMNGVKSLGILLNRVQGNTETWGSVQMKVITDMVLSFQRKSKRLIEQVGAMWLQLNGVQGHFKLNHKPLDYQSEIQKWEAQTKKTQHYIMAQNQRWINADYAANAAIGVEKAEKDLFEGSNVNGVTLTGKEIEAVSTSNNDNDNSGGENSNEEQS